MDIVYLHDLRISTVIGVFEWEQRIRQVVTLDLDMATDIRKAAASDNIRYALNYKEVAKRLIEFVSNSRFQLIEALGERIAELVLTEFGVKWVRLRVNKQEAIRGARDVGIVIERSSS